MQMVNNGPRAPWYKRKKQEAQVAMTNQEIIEDNLKLFKDEFNRLGVGFDQETQARIGAGNINFKNIPEEENLMGVFKHRKWYASNPEHLEVEVDEGLDLFEKYTTLTHESVHAVSATEEQVGLSRQSFFKGLNEGLTEHLTWHLISKSKLAKSTSFEKSRQELRQNHPYTPFVEVWDEWFKYVAEKRIGPEHTESQVAKETEKVRDEVYKLYLDKKPQSIIDFLNREVGAGAAEIFAGVKPGKAKNPDYNASKVLANAKDLLEKFRKNESLIRNPPGFVGNLIRTYDKNYLDLENLNPLAIAAHYKIIIESTVSENFFNTLPEEKISPSITATLYGYISSAEKDLEILKKKGVPENDLRNIQSIILETMLRLNFMNDPHFQKFTIVSEKIRKGEINSQEMLIYARRMALSIIRHLREICGIGSNFESLILNAVKEPMN